MRCVLAVTTLLVGGACVKQDATYDVEQPKDRPRAVENIAWGVQAKETPPKRRVKSARKPIIEPAEFISEKHKFAVLAKREPKVKTSRDPAKQTTIYNFGGYGIKVRTVDVTPTSTDAERKNVINAARNRQVPQQYGQISSDEEIDFAGHLGRDTSFSIRLGSYVVHGRLKIILRRSELFELLWIAEPTKKKLISEASAFFYSFRFTN